MALLHPSRLLPDRFRLPALLVAGVLLAATGVWVSSYVERSAATRVAGQARDGQLMLTAMLDQETGLRGYGLNRREEFLAPYFRGRRGFDSALASTRVAARGDREAVALIRQQEVAARAWQQLAEKEVVGARARHFRRPVVADAFARKARMDEFRRLNGAFQRLIESRRAGHLGAAANVTIGVILALGLVFGLFGAFLIRRGRRAREREREFSETLQVMRSEGEAHSLLREHLERSVHGSRVTVLTRNNSANRLEASTELSAADPLREPLEEAEPATCLAVRMARPHSRAAGAEPLLGCELCGKSAGASLCQPLLVGGEVLGSVLMRKQSGVTPSEGERLAQSVSRAAPALANLRNLAIAQARAQTDPLTRLANRRAINDTVKRLHAQAMRTGSPLSVAVVDLDHFKQINDTYGHDRGDEALAAAADALASAVRSSDFVGRMGGEEFIVLLPDTGADAAMVVAEKLRLSVRALRLAGIERGLSASVGVSTCPDHAVESDSLLRLADRALYLAKKQGRDRVELAQGSAGSQLHDSVPT